MKRVPVTVISGYLGSGKTTMLLHLLLCKQHLRIGFIVNDLAEVNVDAKTIEKSEFFTKEDRMVVISEGSISSDLKQELIEAVYYEGHLGSEVWRPHDRACFYWEKYGQGANHTGAGCLPLPRGRGGRPQQRSVSIAFIR